MTLIVKYLLIILAILASLGVLCGPTNAALPNLDARFEQATARTEGEQLIISTGSVERRFFWRGYGFVTTSFKSLETGKE